MPAPVLAEIGNASRLADCPLRRFAARSHLLSNINALSSIWADVAGSVSGQSVASKSSSFKSAAAARARARRTPSASISSSAARKSGRIGQDHRIACDIQMHLDHVAGRAGAGRDDGRFAARQQIQKARFAGIGRAQDRDVKAIAQPLAAMPVVKILCDFLRSTTGYCGPTASASQPAGPHPGSRWRPQAGRDSARSVPRQLS